MSHTVSISILVEHVLLVQLVFSMRLSGFNEQSETTDIRLSLSESYPSCTFIPSNHVEDDRFAKFLQFLTNMGVEPV